ncbi:MAG: pyruvate formate lyase family protein [Chloroflexota bacterium]|nr:pyruvate formate lyase family protein [Chloroflexota bacterium]
MREATRKLAERIRDTPREVDVQRSLILTRSYRETEGEPIAPRRAKALSAVLVEMDTYINDGELIVGNQARKPKAGPLFPEYAQDWRLTAASIALAVLAVLLVLGCTRQASAVAPTVEAAIASFVAQREGDESASTIRIVGIEPWRQGLVVMFDVVVTLSGRHEPWEWFMYVVPEENGWTVDKRLGAQKHREAWESGFCNQSTTGHTREGFDTFTGRVCDARASQVRIVWRHGEYPPAVEPLMRDGRFFAVHPSFSELPPCLQALDENGQALFILDMDPGWTGPVPTTCRTFDE